MLKEMIDILSGYAQENNLEFNCDCDFDDDRKIFFFRFLDPVSHNCFRRCFFQQTLDVFAPYSRDLANSIIAQLKLAFSNDY